MLQLSSDMQNRLREGNIPVGDVYQHLVASVRIGGEERSGVAILAIRFEDGQVVATDQSEGTDPLATFEEMWLREAVRGWPDEFLRREAYPQTDVFLSADDVGLGDKLVPSSELLRKRPGRTKYDLAEEFGIETRAAAVTLIAVVPSNPEMNVDARVFFSAAENPR
jgi:hypothetical protein